jgi:DNA-binding FadR family transcriptional regulator
VLLEEDQFSEVPRIRQRYEQIADHLLGDVRAGRLSPGERLPGERELAQRLGVGRASVREALGFLQVQGVVETRRGAGSFVAADVHARLAAATPAGAADGLPADASPAALLRARVLLEPAIAREAARARADALPAELGSRTAPGPRGPAPLDALLARMAGASDPEDPAQRRVWSDADRDFHLAIAAATGNPVLEAVGAQFAALMDQPLWRRLRDDSIGVPGRTVLQLAEHRLIAAAIADGDPDAAEDHARRHITRARHFMALD